MKKIFAVVVLLFAVAVADAQLDSLKAVLNKKRGLKTVPKDRIAIDLLATNLIHGSPNGFSVKWYSRGINLYFYWDFRIKKSRVSFAPGIGLSYTNFYNNSQLTDSAGPGAQFRPIADYETNYKINKFTLGYIDIPLELRIRTNRDKLDQCWKFAIGFKAGVRIDAYTKQSTKVPEQNIRLKPFTDFNLFRAGPTLRIGYSSFNITAYYGVLGLFKTGRGPVMNEFAVGLSFNGL